MEDIISFEFLNKKIYFLPFLFCKILFLVTELDHVNKLLWHGK